MVRSMLIRGMLAGLLAGLLVFAIARVLGEPQVERAIAFEHAMEAAHTHGPGHAHDAAAEPEPVSRPVQAGLGLFTGVTVHATAFGGLFALVFAVANGRATALPPRATAALLAAAGFVAVSLVPGLKYPANPPAVGEAATIGLRTGLYFAMLGVSVAAMAAALLLRRSLVPGLGGWNAALVAGAGYLIVVAAAASLLPAVSEVPEGFPADLLWRFRVVALGMQAVLWATIGLVFGGLAERLLRPRRPGLAVRRPLRA